MATQSLISLLHAAQGQWVLALTGGGASAAGELLSVPGGSRTILEVYVPYHEQALAEFLGQRPENYCSVATSQAMARRALDRARWLMPGAAVFGLASTASLISDRPKRGDHRIHVTTANSAQIRTWSLILAKGARDRQGEEAIAMELILAAMARTLDVPLSGAMTLLPGETVEETAEPAVCWPTLLDKIGAVLVAADGRLCLEHVWNPDQPQVLIPGAFNPLHEAHLRLAELAERLEGRPACFELSTANVDKPPLLLEETRRRLGQFSGKHPVWLTRAPRFLDKATLFPGATFVLGVDTALRLVDARYYGQDEHQVLQALDMFRRQNCRFLVAGRVDAAGRFLTLDDVAIPGNYRELFRPLAAESFRLDVSSTKIRNRCP